MMKLEQLQIQATALCCMLMLITSASAMPLFTQAPLDEGDGLQSVAFDDIDFADDFILTSDAIVNGVRFFGSFFDDGVSTESTDAFRIRIFDTLDGSGSINADETPTVTRTSTSFFDIVGAPIFQFDATLADLLLNTGATYFLSIDYIFDAIDAEFFLLQSNETGTTFFSEFGDPFEEDFSGIGDLAFTILGEEAATTIPEPGTITLFGLGFMLLRRRQTRLNG